MRNILQQKKTQNIPQPLRTPRPKFRCIEVIQGSGAGKVSGKVEEFCFDFSIFSSCRELEGLGFRVEG